MLQFWFGLVGPRMCPPHLLLMSLLKLCYVATVKDLEESVNDGDGDDSKFFPRMESKTFEAFPHPVAVPLSLSLSADLSLSVSSILLCISSEKSLVLIFPS